jgi:glyoxylase-like metal-dependent hydrolase (beta-lactamase superfamily II)
MAEGKKSVATLFQRWARSTEAKVQSEPLAFRAAADLVITQVEPGVYRATQAFPWPANALAVELADGSIFLCDTLYTPEAMETFLGWLETRFQGKRTMVAVNTHFHIDRVGGNPALNARKIPVWGSDKTAALLQERGETMRSSTLEAVEDSAMHDRLAALKLVPPSRTFKLGGTQAFNFAGERVEVRFPGAGHSPDNLVVFFPRRGLLFGGCMVRAEGALGNLGDADLPSWATAIETLAALKPKRVVTGHGDDDSPDVLELTARALEEAANPDR